MNEHRGDMGDLQINSANSVLGSADHALPAVRNTGPSLIYLL